MPAGTPRSGFTCGISCGQPKVVPATRYSIRLDQVIEAEADAAVPTDGRPRHDVVRLRTLEAVHRPPPWDDRRSQINDRPLQAGSHPYFEDVRSGVSIPSVLEPARRVRRQSRSRHGVHLRHALSMKTSFRGPLVAQTSIGRLAQPCGARPTLEAKSPANEAVWRSSSPPVSAPDPVCHAGGRGFESRRSRLEKPRVSGVLRFSTDDRANRPGSKRLSRC